MLEAVRVWLIEIIQSDLMLISFLAFAAIGFVAFLIGVLWFFGPGKKVLTSNGVYLPDEEDMLPSEMQQRAQKWHLADEGEVELGERPWWLRPLSWLKRIRSRD